MNKPALSAACAAGFAFSVNYTNHAPMLPLLRQTFAISQAQAGALTTAIFLTHALMQIPGGRLADRFGPLRVLTFALAWVALTNAALSFAPGYLSLLALKSLAGLGTGACFAAGARYVVASFRGASLQLAQGLYGGSVFLGAGFVIFAIPQLLGNIGWSGSFLACASVALLVCLLCAFFAPHPIPVTPPPASIGEMLSHPELWLLGVIQMASFGLTIVIGTWITTLLHASLGLNLKTAGLLGSLVLLLGILTRPFGGWLAHRLPLRPLLGSALLLNVAGCLILAVTHSALPTFAAIAILALGCGIPYAGSFNRAAALFPGRAGAAMGLVNMIGILMILAGAPAIGALADSTGSFRTSFLALAVFTLIAAGAVPFLPKQKVTHP